MSDHQIQPSAGPVAADIPQPATAMALAGNQAGDDRLWHIIVTRDRRFADAFRLGVLTTGIYCRPGCPARTPLRQNVRFFADAHAAEAAGFRACKRCAPQPQALGPEQRLVLAAMGAIDRRCEVPGATELASLLGVETRKLARAFGRVLGVAPADMLRGLKRNRFRAALKAGESVTEAVYTAGFGGPARVYDGGAAGLGMAPGRFAAGGGGETVSWRLFDCPHGRLLIAATDRGIAMIAIDPDDAALLRGLGADFPAARLVEADGGHALIGAAAEAVLAGLSQDGARLDDHGLPLDLRAGAFTLRVWEALRRLPAGQVTTYGALARALGNPGAARAVGRACATNKVALLVPCHRVVPEQGGFAGYRWGERVKRALLATEGATLPPDRATADRAATAAAGEPAASDGPDAPASGLRMATATGGHR